MSQKERVRSSVMKQVQEDELKLVEASEVLGLSYRQAKRIWGRYELQGDGGLVHAARGRPGKRGKPAELKARILARYDERYPDFGPTLAAEYLAEEGLKVDHETLRRWLLAKGKPRTRRRRQRHPQCQARYKCTHCDEVMCESCVHRLRRRGEKTLNLCPLCSYQCELLGEKKKSLLHSSGSYECRGKAAQATSDPSAKTRNHKERNSEL